MRRERLTAGTVQRELAEHAVVVRFGARPDRLRSVGKRCDSCREHT